MDQLFGYPGRWHLSARKTVPYHAWCGAEWAHGRDYGKSGTKEDTSCPECLKALAKDTPVTPARWR